MAVVEDVSRQITDYIDNKVRELSQQDYHDVLEEVISDLESKYDCVKQELAEEDE